jgi:hypothetical protein
VHAYDDVFLLTVAFMAISLALAVVMHEKPPSENTIEVAEGRIQVPEY